MLENTPLSDRAQLLRRHNFGDFTGHLAILRCRILATNSTVGIDLAERASAYEAFRLICGCEANFNVIVPAIVLHDSLPGHP